MFRKEIERIIEGSDIPNSRKMDVIDCLEICLTEYITKGKDTEFSSTELRDFWFYLKINILSRIASMNANAYRLLCRELSVNARKFLNQTYRTQKVGKDE